MVLDKYLITKASQPTVPRVVVSGGTVVVDVVVLSVVPMGNSGKRPLCSTTAKAASTTDRSDTVVVDVGVSVVDDDVASVGEFVEVGGFFCLTTGFAVT